MVLIERKDMFVCVYSFDCYLKCNSMAIDVERFYIWNATVVTGKKNQLLLYTVFGGSPPAEEIFCTSDGSESFQMAQGSDQPCQ